MVGAYWTYWAFGPPEGLGPSGAGVALPTLLQCPHPITKLESELWQPGNIPGVSTRSHMPCLPMPVDATGSVELSLRIEGDDDLRRCCIKSRTRRAIAA